MIQAPIPANESARLNALDGLDILDTPMEERFERITRMVCRLLGVPAATVSLVSGDRQWFKSVRGIGARETPRDISFCSHTILQDEPTIVPDASQDARFHDNPLVTGPDNIQFYAGRPLHAPDGSRVGALCAIDHKPREFSAEDRQTLDDLAAMVESEIRAASLSTVGKSLAKELSAEKRRAMIDPLTGVLNKAGISHMLDREFADAQRTEQPLGLLMADLDNFKAVNDTHGHLVGDEVLRESARRIVSSVRPHDVVGRFGGEEFLVLVPHCQPKDISAVAQRVRRTVADSPMKTADGPVSATLSIGATSNNATADIVPIELIKRADDALYRAKDLGRNRVELAAPPIPAPAESQKIPAPCC